MSLRLALSIVTAAVFCSVASAENWPGWRGPNRDGHSDETGLPMRWSDADIVWKAPLEGWGQSSPVVWNDRIFLTTALDGGRQRVVICLDRGDGSLLWEQTAWTGEPEETHKLNGWASATCATDGERVYAFFGAGGGLFCYSADGELLWEQELGPLVSEWGTAACPVLVDDLVIQNCDADADAYLVAFNKQSGDEVWRTPRENYRGWSTPVLIHAAGRDELVVNGHTGVRAYNPATGEEYWYCAGFNGRGTPTVTPAGDLLYVVNGLRGDTYTIRPGGRGDVTATHRGWHTLRTTRDLPSPIVVNGVEIICSYRSSVMTAYDAASGEELWRERVEGDVSASPVAWNGHAFFITEAGETLVVDPREKIVARNTITPAAEEFFRASITPNNGQVLIRSDRMLYCIGRPAQE